MTNLDEVNVYPFGRLPDTQEFALRATLPAAQISTALTSLGGIPAQNRFLRIFTLDEPNVEDVVEYDIGDPFLAIRKSADPELLGLPRTERLRGIRAWIRQTLEVAARTWGWDMARLQQALELAGEAPRFDTRTQYRYNNQRTLRVCVAFEIDYESVRRYRLKMEDSVTTLATGEHSERSFADFGTLRRDFSRSRWDGSGRGFVLNLFGEGNLLRVEAPLDWVSKGRFGRSTEDAPPNRVERHSVRLVQRDHLSPHQFWQLIGSLDGRPSDSTAIAALAHQLAALGEGAIKTFAIYLNEALAALDTEEHREQPVWDITAESDTSPISLSDDCFLYARCSVIGKGEANWRRTVLQPSKMRGVHDLGAEQLLYVSVLALSQL